MSMEEMLREQIARRGVESPVVLDAIRHVPREYFVPEGMRDLAYSDQALSIGSGQTISQPYMVALMTDALEVKPHHRVLEVGTGSGYQTAILAQLAERVFTMELIASLMERAELRLKAMGIRNVEFRVGDGTLGWAEEAPFDRIIIAAAAPEVPRALLEGQLADGGIAVLPAGRGDMQYLWKITRKGNELRSEDLGGCRFVKLLGKEGWQQ